MTQHHVPAPRQELRGREAVEMRFGPFHPGDRCNQYEIVAELGGGGYGCVYEARRELAPMIHGVIQSSEEFVALKCLQLRHAGDVAARERLNQEALLLKELKHENFVRFVDWGVSETGIVFYVMELLEGKTLAEELASGPMSVRRSLEIALQIAEGLAFAHEKGIVHRDLKPQNVFVTRRGKIKVLDLGAAKYEYGWFSSNAKDRPPCTVTYASPQQLLGEDVDHRTDVFALGEILYKMLTGQHPFGSAAETYAAYAKSQLQCRAKPLADFGVPTDVAALVHRALAKRPEDRQSSMADLLAELRRAWSRLCCSTCRVGEESDPGAPSPIGRTAARPGDESRAATVTVANPMKVFTNPTRPGVDAIGRSALAELIQRCRLGSWQGPKGPPVQRARAAEAPAFREQAWAQQLAWGAQAAVVSRPAVRRSSAVDEPKKADPPLLLRTSRRPKLGRALSVVAVMGFILVAEGLVVNGWRRAADSRAASAPTTGAAAEITGANRGEVVHASAEPLHDPEVAQPTSTMLSVSPAPIPADASKSPEGPTPRKRASQRRGGALVASTTNELGVIPLPAVPRAKSAAPKQPAALAGIHVPRWENLLPEDEHLTAEGGP